MKKLLLFLAFSLLLSPVCEPKKGKTIRIMGSPPTQIGPCTFANNGIVNFSSVSLNYSSTLSATFAFDRFKEQHPSPITNSDYIYGLPYSGGRVAVTTTGTKCTGSKSLDMQTGIMYLYGTTWRLYPIPSAGDVYASVKIEMWSHDFGKDYYSSEKILWSKTLNVNAFTATQNGSFTGVIIKTSKGDFEPVSVYVDGVYAMY